MRHIGGWTAPGMLYLWIRTAFTSTCTTTPWPICSHPRVCTCVYHTACKAKPWKTDHRQDVCTRSLLPVDRHPLPFAAQCVHTSTHLTSTTIHTGELRWSRPHSMCYDGRRLVDASHRAISQTLLRTAGPDRSSCPLRSPPPYPSFERDPSRPPALRLANPTRVPGRRGLGHPRSTGAVGTTRTYYVRSKGGSGSSPSVA